jgi:ribonuclease-3
MFDLESLEKVFGFTIKDPDLFERAFIHKSYVNENPGVKHNERLEFLGDAVLELVVTDYLFAKFEEKPEGELTALRSALVRGRNLAKVSKSLEIGQFLILSNGEEQSGGRHKDYILANLCEAVIGAIFLDQGYEVARKFIYDYVLVTLDEILASKSYIDAKTHFQEMAQEKVNITPEYTLEEESGPDHSKVFRMAVYLNNEKVAIGAGSSKQKAEQDAAKNALELKGW